MSESESAAEQSTESTQQSAQPEAASSQIPSIVNYRHQQNGRMATVRCFTWDHAKTSDELFNIDHSPENSIVHWSYDGCGLGAPSDLQQTSYVEFMKQFRPVDFDAK